MPAALILFDLQEKKFRFNWVYAKHFIASMIVLVPAGKCAASRPELE